MGPHENGIEGSSVTKCSERLSGADSNEVQASHFQKLSIIAIFKRSIIAIL